MAAPICTSEVLHRASEALQDATRQLYAALSEQSAARFALDEARARLLVSGVDGRNAEVREAQLRLALPAEFERLKRASVAVSDCRASLKCTRAAWDCLRYDVRLAMVTSAAELPF